MLPHHPDIAADRPARFIAGGATFFLHLAVFMALAFALERTIQTVAPVEQGPVRIAIRAAKPTPKPEPVVEPPKELTRPKPVPPEPVKQAKPEPTRGKKRQTVPEPAKPHPAPTPAPVAEAAPPAPTPLAASKPDATVLERLAAQLLAGVEREKRYPLAARRARVTGDILVRVRIGTDGRIISAESVGRGNAMLEKATVETMSRVRRSFQATVRPASTVTLEVPVRYRIQ